MLKRWIALVGMLCMVPCLTLPRAEANGQASSSSSQGGLSAWVTYWDFTGALEETRQLGDSMTALIFFAAYFNEDNTLFVPNELDVFDQETNLLFDGNQPDRYISFVNDRMNGEGAASLKDTDLLWELFGSPESTQAHVDELLALTQDYGFDGIEIDYERLNGDLALWQRFLSFLSLLYERTEECGLKLRVLLEPSAPLARLSFPSGPLYVMMCYNLYGDHSGPGPKADDALIQSLIHSMEALPGGKGFALATGGFHWVDGQRAQSLTQDAAEALADANGQQAVRDEASGGLHFQFFDGQGRLNTIWYADGATLSRWRDVIAGMGEYHVSLWRLGGNRDLDALAGQTQDGIVPN